MKRELPSIVITGASGFIGRHILENLIDDYIVFAIARRSRIVTNIPFHQNLHWIQCDIAKWKSIEEVKTYIVKNGGAKYVIHLAAFYDFTYENNPEYLRTNIVGTENILELAQKLNVKRFIFASSLAACKFSENSQRVNELSLLESDYEYAWSKRIGEELVKTYSQYFPCSVVRLAAVFSDWCEYGVLYKFLQSWLSHKYYSRILGGKGKSAIPYIHVHDLVLLLKKIIDKTNKLKIFDVYIASPDGSTSHNELFEIATRYYLGKSIKPIFIPNTIAYLGIASRMLLQKLHLTSEEYFEKLWMLKYTDLKLDIDSSYTRKELEWNPTPRYHIIRRMFFLLEKMRSHPDEWLVKNEATLKRVTRRANFLIYEQMIERKENLIEQIKNIILSEKESKKFMMYKKLEQNDFHCYMSALYHLLLATVRSGDRSLMIKYIDEIAIKKFAEGFEPQEICDTLSVFKEIIVKDLIGIKDFSNMKQEIYDCVGLTIQLAQDEIEDLYESLLKKMPRENISESSLLPDCEELQKMIRQLSAFYQIFPEKDKNR